MGAGRGRQRRERGHRVLAARPLNLFSMFEDITTVCLAGGQLGVPTGALILGGAQRSPT